MTHGCYEYDVSAEIDRRGLSGYQIFLFVLCGSIIALDGFDIQVVSFAAPILADHVAAKVSALGPVFASGLIGLMVGSLALSPFGDRFGRKRLIQLACLDFGIFTILTAYVDSLPALIAVRFLTGLGLGGCIPNVVALASEFAPQRARARTVAITISATPLGAVIGGLACWALFPTMGWQSVFWIGGALPLIGSVALHWCLPESIRFMVAAGRPPASILLLLKRIAPDFEFEPGSRFAKREEVGHGVAVKQLFVNGQAQRTLLLWTPYFMVFLISFLLSSWLPSVLKEAGLPLSEAMVALMTFNLGGVIGAVILGRLIDRLGVYGVLSVAFFLCAASVVTLGYVTGFYQGVLFVIFVAGICVQGTICSLYALASTIYPTSLRVTGIGWAAGAGRTGAIFGPLIGGAMLQAGWDLKLLFASAAIPALISIGALVRMRILAATTPDDSELVASEVSDALIAGAAHLGKPLG